MSQDGACDELLASRVDLWRNAISLPTGRLDSDASDEGRGLARISGSTRGVGSDDNDNALGPHDTPDSDDDDDNDGQCRVDKPVSRLLRFTTGGHKRLYDGTASLTSWRLARRLWLLFRAEQSRAAEQWVLDFSRLYDELVRVPFVEGLESESESEACFVDIDVPTYLAGTLDVLRYQYGKMKRTPREETVQPLARHMSFLLGLSHDIQQTVSHVYTREARSQWGLLMQRMYVECNSQDASCGWIHPSGMLNLPRNDLALANVGAEPAWENTYNPPAVDYVFFVQNQHGQYCEDMKADRTDPRLKWASNLASEASRRSTDVLRELHNSTSRFQSLCEMRQGMLWHAVQEPGEVPYDLMLSVPVCMAGVDDVVRRRLMCHVRTLTIGSPIDDADSTPWLPTLVVCHTKPGENPRQADNECMMSLVSAVKFMAAIGLKNQPVFGLITRGSIGKLILAWMNTDTNVKYDGLVCVFTCSVNKFDLAEPVDALRFAAFLQRLRKYHEDRMAGIQKRVREFFESHDGAESLDWTANAHTDKIQDALAASGFELTQDYEIGASFDDRSQYIRDIDDLSDVELDEARESHRNKSWWYFPDPDDETADDDEASQSDDGEDVDASSENEDGSVYDSDSGNENENEDSDQDQGYSDEYCGSEDTVGTTSDQNSEDEGPDV